MQPDDLEKTQRLAQWSKRKVRTHLAVRNVLYFEEKEIWWSCLGENIGNEINGKHDVFERPVIIFKKLSADILMAIPVTTKLKNGSWFLLLILIASLGEPCCRRLGLSAQSDSSVGWAP